jgi:diguanylate cyclase (GGDEF)-like protein
MSSTPEPYRAASTGIGHDVRAIWFVYASLGVLLLAYLGLLIARPASESSTLIDGWGVVAFNLVASGLCIARGLTRRAGRLVPLVLGASVLSWALGDLALTIESLGGATPPTPSVADAFYLAFFPLAYAGIVLFIREEVRRLSAPSWLDSAIAALGAAAVCAAFAFHSLLHAAGGGSLAVATNLAYPVGDLLLLALVVGSAAMLAGRSRAPWVLLATGMALNATGDTFNLFGSGIGATHVGVVVNGIAWPGAILLISIAMWVPHGHANPLVLQRATGFLLPGLAAACAFGILVFGTLSHVGAVAVGLAAATLAVVGIRLTASVHGLRSLTHERQHQSVTDHLTGLGNRRYLFGVLEAFFAGHADSSIRQRRMAFLYIDLDGFKEINDSFGHPAGDELLRQLGKRFTGALRATDALVRLGGDEFAAVLMDADADDATTIAQQLSERLDEPFVLDAVSVRIGASIGIARAPDDATDGDGLVACADVAMYRAKLRDEAFALYEQDFDDKGNLLRLAEELRLAVAEGELALHYQPQLDINTGEILAVEALVRWPHPRLGLIPPLKFLPLAEQAGLMKDLTRWVLDRALAQCASWRNEGAEVAVSVNISASNLIDAGFARTVLTCSLAMISRHMCSFWRSPRRTSSPSLTGLESLLTSSASWVWWCRSTTSGPALRRLRISARCPSESSSWIRPSSLAWAPTGARAMSNSFARRSTWDTPWECAWSPRGSRTSSRLTCCAGSVATSRKAISSASPSRPPSCNCSRAQPDRSESDLEMIRPAGAGPRGQQVSRRTSSPRGHEDKGSTS